MLRLLKRLFRSAKQDHSPDVAADDQPEWHFERALIYPPESASEEELKITGRAPPFLAADTEPCTKIVGLEQLKNGSWPPPWFGGPITPVEMESNSLCCAVVLADDDSDQVISSLRDALPPTAVRSIAYPMAWN